jgi:hypothetical protein
MKLGTSRKESAMCSVVLMKWGWRLLLERGTASAILTAGKLGGGFCTVVFDLNNRPLVL